MEENKNVLDKWFYFREEELESLSGDDKEYSYYFEKYEDTILNCLDSEMY